MEFKTFLFYAFSVVLVLAALRVITARNPVHSALFLVLAFFSAAGIWLLLKAEFLAIVLVLVYVGAVMVLFLFVVMMLDINLDKMREGFWAYFPLAATIGVIIVLEWQRCCCAVSGRRKHRCGGCRHHRRHQGAGHADLYRICLRL